MGGASATEDAEPSPGHIAVGARARRARRSARSTCRKLDTIVDPLLVPDLATMVWAPHGHREAVDALRRLAQIVLIDTQDEPDVDGRARRASPTSSEHAYVVDLAWLRSTPWRERVAAAFDPPHAARGARRRSSAVTVRHREDSLAAGAAVLRLAVLAAGLEARRRSRARRRRSPATRARTRQEVASSSSRPSRTRPGSAGVTIETASGEAVSLDRAPGGLRAVRRARDGSEQAWTVLGASRGEGGILGEGVRQALLRDPTYRPALEPAHEVLAR